MEFPFMKHRPVTPTSLKQADECVRYGVLLEAVGRDKYDPLHAEYGSAFGAGCAAYSCNPTLKSDVRRGLMLIEASKLWGFTQKLEMKTWPTLVKLLLAYANEVDDSGLVGLETETRILVTVTEPYEEDWKIGGAFDLLATNGNATCIHDFKAVASEYYYSWESDPQILHYTLLQYIRWRLAPTTTVQPTGLGNYFVGVIPSSNEFAFHVRSNHLGIWRTLPTHVGRCKSLYRDQDYVADFGIHVIPTKPSQCNGKRPCYFIPNCYDDEEFDIVGRTDPRVFNRIENLTITRSELDTYTRELMGILQKAESEAKQFDAAHAKMVATLCSDIDLDAISTGDSMDFLTRGLE